MAMLFFVAAIVVECLVLCVFILAKLKIIELGFLWLNPIGAGGVIVFSLLFHSIKRFRVKV